MHNYWYVRMASDVSEHYQKCTLKLMSKSQATQSSKAPLMPLPFGRPWEIFAIDVLQVPLST